MGWTFGYEVYAPLKTEHGYVLHCAFPDCICYPYILPGYEYDRLSGYRYVTNETGKFYKTYEKAIIALKRLHLKVKESESG